VPRDAWLSNLAHTKPRTLLGGWVHHFIHCLVRGARHTSGSPKSRGWVPSRVDEHESRATSLIEQLGLPD
jgi:hypothetical protein